MTSDGPDSPQVDDTASTPPPDIDDALDGDAPSTTDRERRRPGAAEARGPHLPDRWPVLVFIGLAILAAWATYPNPPAWTAESFVAFVLDLLPTVCAVLLPARPAAAPSGCAARRPAAVLRDACCSRRCRSSSSRVRSSRCSSTA